MVQWPHRANLAACGPNPLTHVGRGVLSAQQVESANLDRGPGRDSTSVRGHFVEVESPMDHPISTAPIEELALPERAYYVLIRHNVRTVEDLVALTEGEMLRWRSVGPGTVAGIKERLAVHGLALSQPLPPPDPESMERARWLGRQLDLISKDDRAGPRNVLGTTLDGVPRVERRRYAWRMYRWASGRDTDWPDMREKGGAFDVYPLPGSVELHLEGLNRLAHEELGS